MSKDKDIKIIKELEENWKRALADYKNLEKRSVEEKTILIDFANRILVEQLLPVVDNFTMLEEHLDDEGLKICINEFKNILESAGLEQIIVDDDAEFDPEIMDAVETGLEFKIVRSGYKFRGKLIRPASVVVKKENTNI